MFANLQNTQNAAQPFGSQPSTGGFGLFNNQPQNNAFNSTTPQPGNIFGAQTQQPAQPFGGQPAQGQGLFGGVNQNSNANPAVPAFGTGNNVFGNNQASQSAFGAFGQNQASTAFGNNQNQSSLPSFGTSNNAFGSAPAQGGGVFGSNQTQGQGTNLFAGNPQPQQTGGSIFGNTQQQQPAFGNNAGTPFGNNNAGGSIFGGAGNNSANTGGNIFGSFGSNNNANNNLANKGAFGGNNNAASPFGGANNNTANVFGTGNTGAPFGNNQGPSIFGGANNNNNNAGLAFGNNNQQPQNNVFGATTSQPFGSNPATTNQQFGAFGQATSTSIFNKSPTNNAFNNTPPKGPSILGGPSNQTFAFGSNTLNQQNQAFSAQPTNQNAFGNTTWGVPTNGPIAVGGAQPAKFTALKPKNAKIDGKHLVKCITLLDQNTNFCKNQLRIRHIMTGGQVPGQTVGSGFGQPVGGGQGFFGNGSVNTNVNNNSGLGFSFSKQQGNAFGQQQQTGAFGQQSNPFGQQQNNAFGQQQTNAFGQQQPKPFGQQNNAFGTTSTLFGGQQGFQNVTQPVAGGSPALFGGNNTVGATGGSGLFGNNTAAQPTNTGFGIGLNNNPTTPTNTGLFGGGNNTAFKQAGNLFGGSTAPTTPAFGNTQQPSSGFSLGLGNQNQQPAGGNLFGSNPATNQGGVFGGNNTGMFSGLSQPAQTSTQGTQGSLFGGGGFLSNNQPQTSGLSFGLNAQPSTPTLFGQKTGAQPTPTLFGNQSIPNLSGMFSNTPTTQNSQNLASQSIFSSASQAQSQAQAQAQALFGGQPGSTPAATINQGSDLATILLNGLFNTEFFKKLVTSQNTPFDSLKMEAKKRNDEKKQDFFGQKITNNEDDFSVGYIPRYNKNHKAMYSSLLNFNQSPYMYNQIGHEPHNEMRQTQKLRQRFNNKNEKFEPKILSERRPERPIVNERTSQVRPQPQGSASKKQVQRKSKLIANEQDLPKLDKKYKIEPSIQQLKEKTSEQLKRVPNVQIWNQHGRIVFKSPINLYRKVISDCVFIGENTIDINDVEWDDKKCQLYFYDFGGYSNISQEEDKVKLEKKMRKWIKKNGMHQHSFDQSTGTLHVEIF